MSIQYDARGNEWQGELDQITGLTVTDARTITATLGALNAESVMDLNGKEVALFDVRTAAANMTLVFEGSIDGVNYMGLPGFVLSHLTLTLAEQYLSAIIITTTHAAMYAVHCAGFRRIRIRESAHTSGTVTVALRATRSKWTPYAKPMPSPLAVTVAGGANAIATLTLPAAGAGLFHYITHIRLARVATAALAGTALLTVTSTNLPGAWARRVGNLMVAGGTTAENYSFDNPLRSSVANTATTIVGPAAGAAVSWDNAAHYYVGA